jgi:predicted kinase
VAALVEILRRLEEIDSREPGQLAIEHRLGPGMGKEHYRAVHVIGAARRLPLVPSLRRSMEIIVLVGLQGSGKSTFCRTDHAATHVLVSKDRFRNHRRPQCRQMQLIEQALQKGRSVVVDNTNPTVEDRATIIELARRYGAEVVGYVFESDLGACLERNARRTGRERVPDRALFITFHRLRMPTLTEGFDRLSRVHLAPDGTFIVEGLEE